jgi:predicted regulator of Ras-like GTPase activity (Roadblock/LC7/MglB family)
VEPATKNVSGAQGQGNNLPLDKQVRSILRKLNSASGHIEASSVMTRDGISVASVLQEGVDTDRLGAMCASLLSLGDTTAKELKRGKVQQLLLEGENGYILIMHVGNKAVLGVVARPGAQLGMVLVEAKKTAEEILRVLP